MLPIRQIRSQMQQQTQKNENFVRIEDILKPS